VTVAGAVEVWSLLATQTLQPVGVVPSFGGLKLDGFGSGKLAMTLGKYTFEIG